MKVTTFNCRSIKNSWHDVVKLCDLHDIVCLQEHWLLPGDLSLLNTVHKDFISVANSAVDLGVGILHGRPYGGTAILFRKTLANNIKIIPCNNNRITVVKVLANDMHFLLCNV